MRFTRSTHQRIVWQSTTDRHLATVLHEVLSHRVQIPVLRVGEEIRMVAALSELHDDVKDGCASSVGSIDGVNITHQNPLIHFTLHLTHACWGREIIR